LRKQEGLLSGKKMENRVTDWRRKREELSHVLTRALENNEVVVFVVVCRDEMKGAPLTKDGWGGKNWGAEILTLEQGECGNRRKKNAGETWMSPKLVWRVKQAQLLVA